MAYWNESVSMTDQQLVEATPVGSRWHSRRARYRDRHSVVVGHGRYAHGALSVVLKRGSPLGPRWDSAALWLVENWDRVEEATDD